MRWIQWFLVGVASASMLSAWADGRGYEPRTVPVNAGVVMFNANDTLVRDVYTFYAMDRRTDLKPLGLSFRNPFAPAGTTRNQAAYWLVDVRRLNDNQLARYKILLISRTSWDEMTAEIREKLRRFVDGGGTLWVDMPQQGASGIKSVAAARPCPAHEVVRKLEFEVGHGIHAEFEGLPFSSRSGAYERCADRCSNARCAHDDAPRAVSRSGNHRRVGVHGGHNLQHGSVRANVECAAAEPAPAQPHARHLGRGQRIVAA